MLLAGDFVTRSFKVQLPESFSQERLLANLEGPICVDGLPTSNKVGVCLHSTPFDVAGRWSFSLANNHIMDFGVGGLNRTLAFLKENCYSFAGAGDTEEDARRPMIFNEDGVRIAVFSCCERQFGIATFNEAGAAAIGSWLYEAIRSIKERGDADFVIISCHAASEFSPWASPRLREFYHSLIDAGADFIHGHHSHVPQGYEIYKGRPIFYGLGNFVVDVDMWHRNPNQLWSLVVDVRFSVGGLKFTVMPCGVENHGGQVIVKKLIGKPLADAENYINTVNLSFESNTSCEACWQEASLRLYDKIYSANTRFHVSSGLSFSLKNRIKKLIFAIWDMLEALIGCSIMSGKSQFYGKVAYNLTVCQSHMDMISTYLGVMTGSLPDYRTNLTREQARILGL